jgi:hypothetical protein
MFDKRVEQMRVRISDDGDILIIQQDPGNEDSIILVPPEQVDLLISWLKDAHESLNEN